MSNCAICGKPLTNPASVAAGVGPVCGNRSYQSRIKDRHGSDLVGWSAIESWELINRPCYSCKLFTVPPKQGEVATNKGYIVRMHGIEAEFFDKGAIGGYCSRLSEIVDGNKINSSVMCAGLKYEARKPAGEMPKQGTLLTDEGAITLDLTHPELFA